jgi:hypothetical protein
MDTVQNNDFNSYILIIFTENKKPARKIIYAISFLLPSLYVKKGGWERGTIHK